MKACSNCGSGDVEHVEESHSLHLYRHRDDMQQCQNCGHIEAYRGVALDPEDDGMAFYNVEDGTKAERPECPVHGDLMQPTKIWPDEGRVQFKCHQTVTQPRDAGASRLPLPTGKCQQIEYVEMEDADA